MAGNGEDCQDFLLLFFFLHLACKIVNPDGSNITNNVNLTRQLIA